MRQIPSEGIYCGECLQFFDQVYDQWKCLLYGAHLRDDRGDQLRCVPCLRDKPRVMTEEEREALVIQGRKEGKA